jgi:hypothetical protein
MSIINWTKLNYGRAPDTYEALSAEKEPEYERFSSDKRKNNKKQKIGKSTTRQSKSQASVNDNNGADVIDAATDSSSILAAYHMDENAESFFEALEENDLEPGGSYDAGTEKGSLLKKYLDGKQNMMKFDYEDDYEKNQYGYDYETTQTTMPQYFLEILKKNDELVGRSPFSPTSGIATTNEEKLIIPKRLAPQFSQSSQVFIKPGRRISTAATATATTTTANTVTTATTTNPTTDKTNASKRKKVSKVDLTVKVDAKKIQKEEDMEKALLNKIKLYKQAKTYKIPKNQTYTLTKNLGKFDDESILANSQSSCPIDSLF